MSYIDCFLAPVPRANNAIYQELARISAQVVKEFRSLRVVESGLLSPVQMPGPITGLKPGSPRRSTGVPLPPQALARMSLASCPSSSGQTRPVMTLEWSE